jgi:hypothetical protein
MSSKVDSSLNSAGLKPEESKALDERPVQSHEEPIISAIKEVGGHIFQRLTDMNGLISTCVTDDLRALDVLLQARRCASDSIAFISGLC